MEFYEQMEKNGQLKPGLRPDERRGWLYNRQTPEGQWEARYCSITILKFSVGDSFELFDQKFLSLVYQDSVSVLTCKKKKNQVKMIVLHWSQSCCTLSCLYDD